MIKMARATLLVIALLTVSAGSLSAAQADAWTRQSASIASVGGIRWHTPDDSGSAVLVEPHPAWPELEGSKWIWRTATKANEVVTFRRSFRVPRSAHHVTGILHVTADNAYRTFLNGEPVGAAGPFSFDGPDEGTWATISSFEVQPERGQNVLILEALNYFGPPEPPDNPAGIIFRLDIAYDCPGASCSHS